MLVVSQDRAAAGHAWVDSRGVSGAADGAAAPPLFASPLTFALIGGNRTAKIHDYQFMSPLGGVVSGQAPVPG